MSIIALPGESDWPTARVQIEYTYRPDGMRSTKTVDGVTTQHIWDGANIVMDITIDGDERTETVYIRGLQLIAAVETTVLQDDSRTVRTVYYLHDGRGSVIQTVNSNGIVEQTYVYAAFGELLSENENDANPFRHNGEYWDVSTEMYYLRHRFYNPATGRFINEDPYWYVGNMQEDLYTILQSANLYVFGLSNPIMFIDPSGLRVELCVYATDEQIELFDMAFEYLYQSAVFRDLWRRLNSSGEVITIVFVDREEGSSYYWYRREVRWDPSRGVLMSDGIATQSAALVLVHELGHAWQHLHGYTVRLHDPDDIDMNIIVYENLNIDTWESPIARQLGEPRRNDYFDHGRRMPIMENPIHFITTQLPRTIYARPRHHNIPR